MQAPYIQPHLQHWYLHCVVRARCYNVVLELINTGRFQKPENGFDQDILLECFCIDEHDVSAATGKIVEADHDYETTVQLWAKAAHKVIEQSDGREPIITYLLKRHPAKAYYFAIDLLSIAFHGIAHRGRSSCYEVLINGHDAFKHSQSNDVEDKDSCSVDALSASELESDGVVSDTSEADQQSDIVDDESEDEIQEADNAREEDDEHEDGESNFSVVARWEDSPVEHGPSEHSACTTESSSDEDPTEQSKQEHGHRSQPNAKHRKIESSIQSANAACMSSSVARHQADIQQNHLSRQVYTASFVTANTTSKRDSSNGGPTDHDLVDKRRTVAASMVKRSSNGYHANSRSNAEADKGRKYAFNTDRHWLKALFDSDSD